MFRASLAALLATTSFIASPALAESEAAVAAEAAEPSDIVVVGQREEYGVKSTSTATKTNTDIKDIPQALTVISESQIEDQQLRSIADILYFVPGATPGTGESNRDQITLRGNNTTADFFVDGIRDDLQYFRDFYNVDRVEVLKGPNAMIFGRGGGGGIVNRVTKRSSLGEYRQLSAAADSFGGFRFTGDVDQPLAGNVGLRVNGMYENGDSFRRHVELERYGINPTVGFQAGPDTRIDLSYEYLHDRRTTDRGVPSDARGGAGTVENSVEPLDGFDKTFFGDPDKSFAKADVHIAQLAVEHRFSESLTLRNRTLYGNYDKAYQNIYPNGPVTDRDGIGPQGFTVRLNAYRDVTERENLFSQTDLVWEGKLGSIDQTLLVGFELGRQEGHNQRLNGVFGAGGVGPSFFDVPFDHPTRDFPAISFNPNGAHNGIKTKVAAAYIQDQIRPTEWLEIVAGLRFDRFSIDVENRVTGAETDRTDNLWSPRLGLILKPLENLSLYASYSRSYLPQSGDQFNSLSATNETLKPERFDNYELGAKWEPIEGLLATAAIYRLDRTNTRFQISPGVFALTGEQRSKGIELGLERSIRDNWQISAGYAWQKAEVTDSTDACPSGDCKVPLVPRHSFSLWSRYDFTKRLGAGIGLIARSKSFASIGNMVKLPGYARVDAALFYSLTDQIEAQLNVENILGVDYFPTAHSDNNIAPGAPTNVKAAVRFTF
ncbi:MAG TPA: TonB-dependent siderophore receptor [Sphingomicrobium sp.]|nr:TonB-dependent siderophore receptor [Sphingomicrobium sp.]